MKSNKKISKQLKIFRLWAGAFWSVIAVVGFGSIYFREAIVDSIQSTPHPALVYIIFIAAGCAVLLLMHAMRKYMIEDQLIQRLINANRLDREKIIKQLNWTPDLLPVYRLIVGLDGVSTDTRASALENELLASEDRVLSRINMANYLGGALVGLGLVGTFIGLLGTLNDLGKIFELLVNVGSKDVDPVAMFGNMIAKLQEPVKGMSTAFVASLYGLMGSLIVGLVSLSVRQAGLNLCKEARELVKDDVYSNLSKHPTSTNDGNFLPPAIERAFQAIPFGISTLLKVQHDVLHENRQLLAKHRELIDRIKGVEIRIDTTRHEMLRQMEEQISQQIKILNTYKPEPIRYFSGKVIADTVIASVTTTMAVSIIFWLYVHIDRNLIQSSQSMSPTLPAMSQNSKSNEFYESSEHKSTTALTESSAPPSPTESEPIVSKSPL